MSYLGYSLPVWPLHWLDALPCRYSCPVLTQRCDSLSIPLLGFNPPSWLRPENPRPAPLSTGQLSWDYLPLQRLPVTGVHVLPFYGEASLTSPKANSAFADDSHTVCFGTAHRLSQPLSDLFLLLPSCHFQTSNVRGVHPSGV